MLTQLLLHFDPESGTLDIRLLYAGIILDQWFPTFPARRMTKVKLGLLDLRVNKII